MSKEALKRKLEEKTGRACLVTPNYELVREVDLPPLGELPTVIIWGRRMFVRNMLLPNSNVYKECLAYTVPD